MSNLPNYTVWIISQQIIRSWWLRRTDTFLSLSRPSSRDVNEAMEEWGRGQRCHMNYKNTVYERLGSNIKFINIKKSHPVWQSQQCQCAIQKLTSMEYYKANFLSEKNVTQMTWFRRLTTRLRGQPSWWERGQDFMRTRTRPKILASVPRWPRGLNIPAKYSCSCSSYEMWPFCEDSLRRFQFIYIYSS